MKKGLIILYLTGLLTLAFTGDGYSTAAKGLTDESNTLCFRDNYHECFYCISQQANDAQPDISALSDNKQYPVFRRYALESCSCSLTKCTQ